jgi:hypothetical protein
MQAPTQQSRTIAMPKITIGLRRRRKTGASGVERPTNLKTAD